MSNTKILIPDDEDVINVSDFFTVDEDQPDTTEVSTSASVPRHPPHPMLLLRAHCWTVLTSGTTRLSTVHTHKALD